MRTLFGLIMLLTFPLLSFTQIIIPMKRAVKANSSYQEHFYSSQDIELNSFTSDPNANLKGIEGTEFFLSTSATGPLNSKIFRLRQPLPSSSFSKRLYTTNEVEKELAISNGYSLEASPGFISTTYFNGSIAIKRSYNSKISDRFYTISESEHNVTLSASAGYTNEAILGYTYGIYADLPAISNGKLSINWHKRTTNDPTNEFKYATIDLYKNDSGTYLYVENIQANLEKDDQTVNWDIPSYLSGNDFKIKIYYKNNPSVYYETSTFSITGQIRTLIVNSNNPSSDVQIKVTLNSNTKTYSTPFNLPVENGNQIQLEVSSDIPNKTFLKWTRNGAFFDSNKMVSLNVDQNYTLVAEFASVNQKPVGTIESILPTPGKSGESIEFKGNYTDPDSDPILEFNWRSNKDGQLKTQQNFTTQTLSVGQHTIYFKVKDSKDLWSDEDENNITVIPYVSGSVKSPFSTGLSNITIEFEGLGNVVTDANGFFKKHVPLNWTGKMTPRTGNYSFVPNSIQINNCISNLTANQFTAYSAVSEIVIDFPKEGMAFDDDENISFQYTIMPSTNDPAILKYRIEGESTYTEITNNRSFAGLFDSPTNIFIKVFSGSNVSKETKIIIYPKNYLRNKNLIAPYEMVYFKLPKGAKSGKLKLSLYKSTTTTDHFKFSLNTNITLPLLYTEKDTTLVYFLEGNKVYPFMKDLWGDRTYLPAAKYHYQYIVESTDGFIIYDQNDLEGDFMKSFLFTNGEPDRSREPILLIHGVNSDATTWEKFANILAIDARFKNKYNIYRFEYPNQGEIAMSAGALKKAIKIICKNEGKKSVNVIAHSMGGLLSRSYLQGTATELNGSIATYDPNYTISKLFMIATPNQGATGVSLISGKGKAFRDLENNSDFLNNINSKTLPSKVIATEILGLAKRNPVYEILRDYYKFWGDVLPKNPPLGPYNCDKAELNQSSLSGILPSDWIVTKCSASWDQIHTRYFYPTDDFPRDHMNILKTAGSDPIFDHLDLFMNNQEEFSSRFKKGEQSYSEEPEVNQVQGFITSQTGKIKRELGENAYLGTLIFNNMNGVSSSEYEIPINSEGFFSEYLIGGIYTIKPIIPGYDSTLQNPIADLKNGSFSGNIVVTQNPNYQGPKNIRFQLESGKLSTGNTQIEISISAENAKMMKISESPENGIWEPFQNKISYSFLNQVKGEKQIFLQLKNDTITTPLYSESILYSPDPTGNLQIASTEPGAAIVINEKVSGQVTPFNFEGLPVGNYTVYVFKPDFVSRTEKINLEIKENKTENVFFELYKKGELPPNKWTKENLSICNAPFNQTQVNIISDSENGAIIVWKDERDDSGNIWAQRVDADGFIKWAENGVPVIRYAQEQTEIKVVEDGIGGAIIAWLDKRDGGIYLQRIGKDGKIQLQQYGTRVIESGIFGLSDVEVAPDGNGGIYIACSFRLNNQRDQRIKVQRIDKNGKRVFGNEGLNIGKSIGTVECIYPKIKLLKNKNLLVTWLDEAAGAFHTYQVYGQIVDSSGNTPVSSAGKLIADVHIVNGFSGYLPNYEFKPAESGGFYMIGRIGLDWDQYLPKEIYTFARFDSEINKKWETAIEKTEKSNNIQSNPLFTEFADSTTILVWSDTRGDDLDIYCQKISKSGVKLWGEDDLLLNSERGNEFLKALQMSSKNECFAVWYNNYNLYTQIIDSKGNLKTGFYGNKLGVPMFNSQVEGVRDNEGNIIFTWTDNRAGTGSSINLDIYAQKVFENGEITTNINSQIGLPGSFIISQNYPNPFNPATTISYDIPENGSVTIQVFDVLGRMVKREEHSNLSAGKHQYYFDGSNHAAGMYFYRISFRDQILTKKMLLIK